MPTGSANQHFKNGVKIFTIRERFLNKVKINPETQCWEWRGFIRPDGYGHFALNKEVKCVLSHRFSYEFYIGEIPNGLLVCHKCDNRKCVNPFHFFLGNDLDNTRDAQNKGRIPKAKHPSSVSYKKGCRCELCRKFLNNTNKLSELKRNGIFDGDLFVGIQNEIAILKNNATLIP